MRVFARTSRDFEEASKCVSSSLREIFFWKPQNACPRLCVRYFFVVIWNDYTRKYLASDLNDSPIYLNN